LGVCGGKDVEGVRGIRVRILFAARNYMPASGGAEKSMQTLLTRLADGHDVNVLCAGSEGSVSKKAGVNVEVASMPYRLRPAYHWMGLYRLMGWWRGVVEKKIVELKPDMVFTQLDFTPPVVEACAGKSVPCVVFVRSFEHFCPDGFVRVDPTSCNSKCWSCYSDILKPFHYPFIKKIQSMHKRALNAADLVLSNSGYMRGVVKDFSGVESEVLYPFIDYTQYRIPENTGECITFLNPKREKGVEHVIKLAESLKERKFNISGRTEHGIADRLEGMGNVEYIPWVDDVRELYGRTRVVLMPSSWPEPFGRVAVEAMLNGIPLIVSDRGSLPELVGDAGVILDAGDLDGWIKAVNRLFNDDSYYTRLSKRCVERAAGYGFDKTYKHFKTILSKKLEVVL
jgi:glycosyltransferase involved in cell wall biosynthesis